MGLLKSILGKVDLDGSGFEKGALKVEHAANRLGHHIVGELKGAGAELLGVFAVGEMVHGIIEAAVNVKHLSEQFRVSTDTVQRWDIAAGKIGETADTVAMSFNKIKKAREGAIGGDEKLANAFGNVGISMADLRDASLDTEKIIERMTDYMSGHEIVDSEDVAAMELAGKRGAILLSIFKQLKELGPVKLMSKEDVESIDVLEKAWKSFKRNITREGAENVRSAIGIFDTLKGVGAFYGKLLTTGSLEKAREAGRASMPHKEETHDGAMTEHAAERHGYTTAKVDLHKEDNAIREQALSLEEKIFNAELAGMNVTEKREALKKKIGEHEDKAFRQMIQGNDAEALKEAEKAQGYLGQFESAQRSGGKNLSVDSLNRLGGFVGGSETVIANTSREQLAATRALNATTREILNQIHKTYGKGLE